MPHAHSLVPCIVCIGVLVAGCGGESGRAPVTVTVGSAPAAITVPEVTDTATVTDPARAAYIARADRVCGTLDPEREAKLHEVEGAQDPVATYAETVTLAKAQLSRIAALTPPPADRTLIARNVIDRLRARLALREHLQRDLAADDVGATARDQAEYEALGVAIRSFARGYGFKKCGTP